MTQHERVFDGRVAFAGSTSQAGVHRSVCEISLEPPSCLFVTAPTPPGSARNLFWKPQERDMNAQIVDTGWIRLLEKIRKLFEPPPRKDPAPGSGFRHAVSGNLDMRGLLRPRRGDSR
jgi:hypothetical protein